MFTVGLGNLLQNLWFGVLLLLQEMMSIVSSHHHCQPSIIQERCGIGTISKVSCSRQCSPCFSGRLAFSHKLCLKGTCGKTARRRVSRICSVVDDDGMNPDNSDDEEKESLDDKTKRVCISISIVNSSHFSSSSRVKTYHCIH